MAEEKVEVEERVEEEEDKTTKFDLVITFLEREIRDNKRNLLQSLEALKDDIERIAPKLEGCIEDPTEFPLNNLGEIQLFGTHVDNLCGATAAMVKHFRNIQGVNPSYFNEVQTRSPQVVAPKKQNLIIRGLAPTYFERVAEERGYKLRTNDTGTIVRMYSHLGKIASLAYTKKKWRLTFHKTDYLAQADNPVSVGALQNLNKHRNNPAIYSFHETAEKIFRNFVEAMSKKEKGVKPKPEPEPKVEKPEPKPRAKTTKTEPQPKAKKPTSRKKSPATKSTPITAKEKAGTKTAKKKTASK